MYSKVGTLVQPKKLPRRNWFQRLTYSLYMQINYRLNVIPMRKSRFKYAIRLIIGITVWLLKWTWTILIKTLRFFDLGFTCKRGKNKASKIYLITAGGYSITIAIKKQKP